MNALFAYLSDAISRTVFLDSGPRRSTPRSQRPPAEQTASSPRTGRDRMNPRSFPDPYTVGSSQASPR